MAGMYGKKVLHAGCTVRIVLHLFYHSSLTTARRLPRLFLFEWFDRLFCFACHNLLGHNEWPVLVFSRSGAKPRTRTHDKDPKSVCADRASRATNAMPPSSCGGRVRLTSWLLEHAQIEGMSTHAAAPLDMAYVPPLLPSPAIQTTHVHGCLARTRTNEPCLIAEIR